MMTNTTWKSETTRNVLTPRSKRLKAIDTAFAAYDQAKSTTNLIALANSVDAWIQGKGNNWKNSTRNSRGTVERLVANLLQQQLVASNAIGVRLRTAQGRVRVAQPQLLTYGTRVDQTDADGRHYPIVLQSKENSCGPCSVHLVAKLVLNQDIAEEYLRELVEVAEDPDHYVGSLGSGGALSSQGSHDWGPMGDGTWLVPAVLRALKINATYTTDTSALLRTTNKKPAVGVVSWIPGGDLHYVVVAGPLRSGALVVLDPFYGVQEVPVAGNTVGTYSPVQNGAVAATGTFTGWVCYVN